LGIAEYVVWVTKARLKRIKLLNQKKGAHKGRHRKFCKSIRAIKFLQCPCVCWYLQEQERKANRKTKKKAPPEAQPEVVEDPKPSIEEIVRQMVKDYDEKKEIDVEVLKNWLAEKNKGYLIPLLKKPVDYVGAVAASLNEKVEIEVTTKITITREVSEKQKIIAVVGGDGRPHSRIPPADNVVYYRAPKDGGIGDSRSLIESIRAGRIEMVYVLSRWNCRDLTRRVRKLSKLYHFEVVMIS